MELQNERLFDVKVRAFRRWLLPLLVVVVAIGLPGVWFGPRIFSRWQQGRLLGHATQSLRKDDVANAAILLRRVLNLNPNNVEATRGLAELADIYVPREAPALRERVCELAPTSYPDATAWALTALRVGQAAQAEAAFELMKKTGKPSAAFHEIGGRVALAGGRFDEARAQFAQALEHDPTNESNQLELAAVEIRLPDAAARDGAREKLERLRENPKLRHAALRALIGERMERGMITEALALAKDLVKDPEATFSDRLQFLAILRAKEDPAFVFTNSFKEQDRIRFSLLSESREPSFASFLNELQEEARGDAVKVASLVAFLNSRGLSLLACEWTGTMAREFVSVPPVALPMAEAYSLTLDWRRLDELIAEGDWEDFEFLRFAYVSRGLREKGDRAEAAAQWAMAINLAEYRYERLVALARSASAWGWTSEFEEILWITARNSKRPREALAELALLHEAKRDTQKLFTIWSRILELDPADATARKNWVRLSLLLGNERYRTGALAHELFQQHPTDPHIVSSYALVLHLRLQDKEALALMNSLKPEELRSPSVAGYYAIILLANQRKEEAAEFLELVRDAPLFREERNLFDQTRRALD